MNGFVADALSANHNESNPVSMFDKTSAPIINQLALEVKLDLLCTFKLATLLIDYFFYGVVCCF